MPNANLKELNKRLHTLESYATEIRVELRWLKWIIVGAAGLGFLEKIFGWLVK